jgi:hypothetical protein
MAIGTGGEVIPPVFHSSTSGDTVNKLLSPSTRLWDVLLNMKAHGIERQCEKRPPPAMEWSHTAIDKCYLPANNIVAGSRRCICRPINSSYSIPDELTQRA